MSGEGALVLVVEDEPQMRRLLRMTLESNGMRFAEATNAREAISRAKHQPPDVILVDLGLPDRDGIEVIREARLGSTAPIIVLSARSQESDKIAALDAGADDYVSKPFSAGELLARLRVALRHAAVRQPPRRRSRSPCARCMWIWCTGACWCAVRKFTSRRSSIACCSAW